MHSGRVAKVGDVGKLKSAIIPHKGQMFHEMKTPVRKNVSKVK